MAEAMISTVYRESLQSLDGMMVEQHANGEGEQEPHKDSAKRVKHGPTTIIQIFDEKRHDGSPSVTASHVVEGKLNALSGRMLRYNCLLSVRGH